MKKVQPKKFLFLVHREQILDQAIESFKNVLGHYIDIEKSTFYGYYGKRVKGLIFCSSNAEASELSNLFNQMGKPEQALGSGENYRTLALPWSDSQEDRDLAIKRLELAEGTGALDYIFTVGIFNDDGDYEGPIL